MFLDRLAIAGISWTARTALSLAHTPKRPKPSATARPRERAPDPERKPREINRYDAAHDPAETQMVLAPDQDLLESFNIEESMGYQGDRR